MNKILSIPFIVTALTIVSCGDKEPTLNSIEVKDPKVEYTVGDDFVKPSVIAHYSDDSTKDIKDNASFSGYNMQVAGNYTVTVTYQDKFDQYNIVVNSSGGQAFITSIEVKNPITEYIIGDEFIKPGVIAHYSDSTTKDVKSEATFTGYDMSTKGEYTVSVSYQGFTTSYKINVNEVDPEDDISLVEFNSKYKNAILNNHNYQANVYSKFDADDEEIANYNLFNLNDTALYDDQGGSEVFAGYVKQKGQGYVDFTMSQQGGGLLLGDFLSTNPNVGISELDPYCVESIVNCVFTKVENRKTEFTFSDSYAIAAIGNLALGDYVIYSQAPEKATITVTGDNSFIIKADYIYRVDEAISIVINVTNMGGITNTSIENHVANPSYIYEAPTSWSDDDKAIFTQYFGEYIPPFVTGASYSFKVGASLSSGMYVVMAEDYSSGDLSSSYISSLVSKGFAKDESTTDTKYALEVEDSTKQIKKTYSVTILYIDPKDDADYALYYPKGIFSLKFQYKETTLATVDTVGKLNDFLANCDAKSVIPALPLDESIKVTGFKDGTDGANKISDVGTFWSFVAPSRTTYFNVYIPTYSEALTFLSNYGTLLSPKGFELSGKMGSFAFNSFGDDYYSMVLFGDIVYAGEASYPGYIQLQISISIQTVENYVDPKDPVEHSISVANVTGGSITIDTPASKLAKAGDTVIFSVSVDEGYTLNNVVVTCNGNSVDVVGPHISTGAYSFTMPDGDVLVGANITKNTTPEDPTLVSLSVVSPKTDYKVGDSFVAPKVLGNYSDNTSREVEATFSGYNMSVSGSYTVTVSYEDVSTTYVITVSPESVDPGDFGGDYKLIVGNNTYTLTFNDDGTGLYNRHQVNSKGEVLLDATLNFTFVKDDNSLTLTFKSLKGDSKFIDFVNGYRLFDADHSINPTGVVNKDGSITMGLLNSMTAAVTNYTFTK